ncbi:MAG: ricin-type beta-trefoil lectin domain protein, partial [Kineosporiaceae bacterium]
MIRSRSRLLGVAAVVFAVAAGAAVAQTASADENMAPRTTASGDTYRRGPDPTAEGLASGKGPFAIASVTVPRQNGFGGGVIYYPTDTSQGKFGAIAWSPGMGTEWRLYDGPAQRLASYGFVVFGTETNTLEDWPDARGDQLLVALDWLVKSSSVRDRIDPARLAVTGHSAGGTGALTASLKRPTLKASLSLAGIGADLSTTKVPTILLTGQADGVGSPQRNLDAYRSVPASVPHAYAEIAGAGHGFPTGDLHMVRIMVSWMKMFIDEDTRYTPFLCPDLTDRTGISQYLVTCPSTPSDPQPVPSTDPVTTPPPSTAPTTAPTTAPAEGMSLIGVQSNRCLGFDSRQPGAEIQAQLWGCRSSLAQRWVHTNDQELRVGGEKCLTVKNQGKAPGTPVVVSACTGTPNQKWDVRTDGS